MISYNLHSSYNSHISYNGQQISLWKSGKSSKRETIKKDNFNITELIIISQLYGQQESKISNYKLVENNTIEIKVELMTDDINIDVNKIIS